MSDADVSSLTTDEDRVRALIVDEHQAVIGYNQARELTKDPELRAIIDDIVTDEDEHSGQLKAWLDKNNPKSAVATAEGVMEGVEQMSKDDAWKDFVKKCKTEKAQYPNQVSVSDKLDSIDAKLGDMAGSIERLDEVVPELAGDMSAIETEQSNKEELGMPEKVEGLVYSDTMEGMQETDATNEASSEGGVDTVPSETAEFDEKLDIGSETAPKKDVAGGEDVDDSTEQLEGVVGEEEKEVVSKSNIDLIFKMIKSLHAEVQVLKKDNVLLKKQVANGMAVTPKAVTPVGKSAVSPEKAIPKMTPNPAMTPANMQKVGGDRPMERVVVSSKPTAKAGYVGGGTPDQIGKALAGNTSDREIKIGMGSNSRDILKIMTEEIDSIASNRNRV